MHDLTKFCGFNLVLNRTNEYCWWGISVSPLILWRLGLEGSKKDDFQCALQMKEKLVGLVVNTSHKKHHN
jgi:hypothetical protein